jgi:predicted dehydrogenase
VNPVRVAIVGCGAVTEKFYLPALARSPLLRIAALVDVSLARAERLAPAGQGILITGDYRDVVASAEAAVVALPNHLHAPVTMDLLRSGIHVLVEKPMALRVQDCDAMISAAEEAHVVLSVGHMRRFYGSCRFVADALAAGQLGRILGFDLRDGGVFSWPLASDYLLRRDAAGGGVLMDLGVHDLDLLMWWLGDYESVVYRDDSVGVSRPTVSSSSRSGMASPALSNSAGRGRYETPVSSGVNAGPSRSARALIRWSD